MGEALPEFDLSRFLPYRMVEAAERLSDGFSEVYRKEFGLSRAEWRVLAHVADAGAVSVRDVHLRVRVEKSKASRAATKLEAAGYLVKRVNAVDRRLVALELTDTGQALMARLLPRATAYQAEVEQLLGAHLAGLEAALRVLERESDN